jgi:hypothetical protein
VRGKVSALQQQQEIWIGGIGASCWLKSRLSHTHEVAPRGVVGFAAGRVNQTPGSGICAIRFSCESIATVQSKQKTLLRSISRETFGRVFEKAISAPSLSERHQVSYAGIDGLHCFWKNTQTSTFLQVNFAT